jgi:hypothetical protein
METSTPYLDAIRDAVEDVANLAPDLKDAIAQGKEQAETRDGVIQTINEMCDALVLASDLIASQLSASIVEFGRIRMEKESTIRGYFGRCATKFSEPSLRLLLHEGKVCGELHKLGDRFETPFSPESISGLSFWDNVKTFFSRSNRMTSALHDLIDGEQDYLRDIGTLLNEVRDAAEATNQLPWGSEDAVRNKGDELLTLMRERRQDLEAKLRQIREAGDAAIQALH